MVYGPLAPRKLPKQNQEKVILLADRFLRAASAQRGWAEGAKENVDFLEGRQWTKKQLADIRGQGRAPLQFNQIAPLVRLVEGYMENNQTSSSFIPGDDASSTDDLADVLTKMLRHDEVNSEAEFVDTEVFLDGITTGRGYYEQLMDFTDNDFGEVAFEAVDPFSVYVDPDCNHYNLDKGANYIMTSRWASVDEVEASFGKPAAQMVRHLVYNDGFTSFPSIYTYGTETDEIRPVTTFGLDGDDLISEHEFIRTNWMDFVDTGKKNIRLVSAQCKVPEQKPVFVDLETGDWKPIPDFWNKDKVAKVLYHMERIGNPVRVVNRLVNRIRWTVMCGDLIVFDDFSPYDKFSITGFFPYFRRGITRGMIDDLKDPQREINKRRSAEIEIVSRTANGGWMHKRNTLDPTNQAKLNQFGSLPGIVIEYEDEAPREIDPSPPPTAMERLEDRARDDLQRISGINEAALGQLDRVQSGRAIEARQRQAVLGVQPYMKNFRRTKGLLARKYLNLVQNHYTEKRLFRVIGEDGRTAQIMVNQANRDPASGRVVEKINDITVGKYQVKIEQVPMSASFQEAQFEEALVMLEKIAPANPQIAALFSDILVDMSSLPRKDELKTRVQQAFGLMDSTAVATGTVSSPAAAGGGGNVVPLPAPTQ